MKKFTDNPWFVELFSSKNQVNVYSECMIHTMHHNKNYAGVELSQEQIANAYLIASAPEMYSLLNRVAELSNGDINNLADEMLCIFDDVELLLAKARGE